MRALGLLIVVLLSGCGGCGREKGGGSKGRPPSPAGGAAAVTSADDLVENAFSFEVTKWSRSLDAYDLTIEDVGMTSDIEGVLTKTGADLVVNGGFFDDQGKPLGLTMSNGIRLSALAKKLSGGVLVVGGGKAELFETESFDPPETMKFAVQCRPRLVVAKQPNVKSDDGKRSERTALCVRDEGKTIEALVVRGGEDGGPSLFALGKWLAAHGCDDALNLDGGPSTGAAWLDDATQEKKVIAPRGRIRHAIVFKKRS